MQVLKKTAPSSSETTTKRPAHQQVYDDLRSRILFGDLIPGQAVTLQGLTDLLDAGMTPVREAVRRLISEGALKMQGNRRVIVPLLSNNCLDQIDFMRKTLETELLHRAFPYINNDALEDLVAQDAALNTSISNGDVTGYLKHNYQFHHLLYQLADASIMTATVDRLWLRFGPSLRVVCGRSGTLSLPDRHEDLLQALRLHDVETALSALKADIEQGTEQIRAAMPLPETPLDSIDFR